jgi:hypothetical protein
MSDLRSFEKWVWARAGSDAATKIGKSKNLLVLYCRNYIPPSGVDGGCVADYRNCGVDDLDLD